MRFPAASVNHNLPSGWALPRGWQAYAIYEITERLPFMLVAAAIAYREMMRAPASERHPATERTAAIPRRRALIPV